MSCTSPDGPAPDEQDAQDSPFAPLNASTEVSRDEALRIALRAFRHEAPGDEWYTEEHLTATLLKRGDDLLWFVSCSGSPIAGGGGNLLVHATTGEVSELHIPPGSR